MRAVNAGECAVGNTPGSSGHLALQIAIYILASIGTLALPRPYSSHSAATAACAVFVAFFVAVARCMYLAKWFIVI